ncbi:MAG: hypothetical protein RI573_07885 [Balneolaceae bacterium]|nr:hypothetical protein [Balneolaceae bacterium]
MTQEELDQLQTKALEQFKSRQPLFGKDGAFAPMLKKFLEAALQADKEAHLTEEERQTGNKRNGKGTIDDQKRRGNLPDRHVPV